MTQAERNGIKLATYRGSLKQEALARDLKISTSAVSMYESGKRTPKDKTKQALATYFGTTVEELFYTEQYHNM